MSKTSYRVLKWTLLGGVVSSLAIACTVTTGDPGTIDLGGEGGTTSKAGTPSTGGSTAGSSAGKSTGGTTAGTGTTGGTAGSEAMGGAAPTWEVGLCQSDNPTPSVVPSCAPDAVKDKDNPCQVCMKAKCCDEWKTCFGSEPTTACFHGPTEDASKDPGQFDCIRFCFDDGAAMASDPAALLADCAGKCAQQCDPADKDNGAIMDSTNALVTCASAPDAMMGCADECFPFM